VIEESKLETQQDPTVERTLNKRKKKVLPFEDSDFGLRKAYPKFESWKIIENLALACNKNENLKVFVLCAGVMYGLGENTLGQHFMSGWLGEIEALPFIAPGDNIIPTVHFTDLARMVAKVFNERPNQSLFVATDQSSDSQLSIVQAISGAMSDGQVTSVPYTEVMLEPWSECLSLHLQIKSSSYFSSLSWHSKEGIVHNIDLLNQEFNTFRSLRSIKVFISGPPVSGKSFYGRKLAENYSIPHIHAGALIQELLSTNCELEEKVRKKLADLKQHMIEEAESKKKKNQELDYSKFNPRVPEDMMAEIVRWKLNSNICRNRGYVLDGWPRKYEDARRLFMKDEDSIDSDIYPDSLITLKATNEYLIARAKAMPEQLIQGTHYNDEGMKRRLQAYRESNTIDKQPLSDFFLSKKSEMLELEANSEEVQNLDSMQKFIERNGKPFKFSAPEEVKVQENIIHLDSVKNLKEDESKKGETVNNVEYLIMIEQLKAKENNLLELRSQPIRNYLMEKVAPAITEALFKICETKPEDSLLFLANYLKAFSK
jgi:adenylate kinase